MRRKNDSVKLTEDQLSQRYVKSLSFYFGNLTNAGLEVSLKRRYVGGNFTTFCITFRDLSGGLGIMATSTTVSWKCNFVLPQSFLHFSM